MPNRISALVKNKKIILTLLLIVLILSTGYVGFAYLERDPNFCASCHLMEEPYNKWKVSAMHNVPCVDCHEQSVFESLNILFKALIYNPENITTHAEVMPETCLKCHGEGYGDYMQILNESGHEIHYTENGIECTECHGVELHVFKPTLQICTECHQF